MATAVERVVHSMRIKALEQDRAALDDRQLLRRFADDGDESAFTELVRRHGSLVFGVCRRILGNAQDAEDAFQATFLVLAKKAGSIPWRESIKNWLHGVAFRIASKARGQALRRKQKEMRAGAQPPPHPSAEAWSELRAVLDEEIERLPAKYRDVLILCYLEGKTRDEAADQLGWSIGSVKGCLERGRELLRSRLNRRGLALSAALAAGLLSEATAGAAVVPTALQGATVEAALLFTTGPASAAGIAAPVLTLTQGALNTMLIAKIKFVGLTTFLLILGTGASLGVYHAATGAPGELGVTPSVRGQDVAPAHFVALAQERERRDDEKKKSNDYFGLIKEVDLKVGTITVTPLRDGDREEQKFSLASKNLKVVSTFGEPLKTSDLRVGLRVYLELKELDVSAIRVEHPNVPAFLTSVDASKRIIRARAERMNAVYEVAADAKITINGRATPLADVPLEERVFLTLSLDRKTVLAMNANKVRRDGERPKEGERPGGERPKDGDRPREERPVERPGFIQGTIVEIDASKNAVTVLFGRGDDLAMKSVALSKDAKVTVKFEDRTIKELTLGELTKPLAAALQLSDDQKSASTLTVQAPTFRGVVKSVDVTAKKISFMTEGRQEKVFDLDPNAAIRVGREFVRFVEAKEGMHLIVGLSLDRRTVIGMSLAPVVRRDGERE